MKRLLLSSVGTSAYEETTYILEHDEQIFKCETAMSPIAFAKLLDIDSALIARTTDVKTETGYDKELRDAFSQHNVDGHFAIVPQLDKDGATIDDILNYLVKEIRSIEPDEIILDISHTFRSLQMVFLTSAIQLAALDEVSVDGIYYAKRAGEGGEAPIIDLTFLYTLIQWYDALRSFRRAGNLSPASDLLEDKRQQGFIEGKGNRELAELSGSLSGLSAHFDSGLPLETGIYTQGLMETIQAVDDDDFDGPTNAFLAPLESELEPFELQQAASVDKKTEIELTRDELERQRDMVQFYLDNHKHWFALECGRELFINRVLYEYYGSNIGWLAEDVRKRIARKLGDLVQEQKQDSTPPPPDALRLWSTLSQYRNAHAHAGFKNDSTPTRDDVKEPVERLCGVLDNDEYWAELLTSIQSTVD